MEELRPMNQDARWRGALALVLLGLVIWAAYLANHRIYQVDEAQNLYMARVSALHLDKQFFTSSLAWTFGPLAWIAGHARDSVSLFEAGRWLFLGVFLINLVLMALNTGVKLRSTAGALALVGAATLAPLWDYGFEVRHDNVLLTGLLLMWWLGRHSAWGRAAYLLMGGLFVALLCSAFKSFAYVSPMMLALLLAPPPSHGSTRRNLWLAWALGALVAAGLMAALYASSGLWSGFAAGMRGGAGAVGGGTRFSILFPLARLPLQIPLVLSLAVAALGQVVAAVWSTRRQALSWEGALPEAALCLGGLFLLYVNPTPFPYNLVNLVPFCYLLAFRTAMPWFARIWRSPRFRPQVIGLLVFTHAVPFAMATARHHDWTNHRQEQLMTLAETMTDPSADRVYDAAGLVPTRASIGYHWFLHSLNIDAINRGELPKVSQMLTEHPASVVIPNYRFDWLPESEWRFLASRYVPLSDDFWVLGQRLPEGGGSYQVHHPGRYAFMEVRDGGLVPLREGWLNERALPNEPVQLAQGVARLRTSDGVTPVVMWVGPQLKGVRPLSQRDHQRLFVNWY